MTFPDVVVYTTLEMEDSVVCLGVRGGDDVAEESWHKLKPVAGMGVSKQMCRQRSGRTEREDPEKLHHAQIYISNA